MPDLTLIDLVFAVFVLTQIGDYYTTYVVIGKQGGGERNDIINWLIVRIGLIPALIIAKGVGLVGGYLMYWVDPSPVLLSFFTLVYIWQVYQNAIRIK